MTEKRRYFFRTEEEKFGQQMASDLEYSLAHCSNVTGKQQKSLRNPVVLKDYPILFHVPENIGPVRAPLDQQGTPTGGFSLQTLRTVTSCPLIRGTGWPAKAPRSGHMPKTQTRTGTTYLTMLSFFLLHFVTCFTRAPLLLDLVV